MTFTDMITSGINYYYSCVFQFLDIYVLDPRTTIKKGRAEYTDYAIHVKVRNAFGSWLEECGRVIGV